MVCKIRVDLQSTLNVPVGELFEGRELLEGSNVVAIKGRPKEKPSLLPYSFSHIDFKNKIYIQSYIVVAK